MSLLLVSGHGLIGFQSASASGTNVAVTITLSASSGKRHYVGAVLWSYSAAPTGGRITSTGLDGDEVDFDITAAGPGPIGLPPAQGDLGGAVAFTLAAAGAGNAGKLVVWYKTV